MNTNATDVEYNYPQPH